MLSGWCAGGLRADFEAPDAAKVEDVMSSLTSGVSVRATDAEQRHRHVFRY